MSARTRPQSARRPHHQAAPPGPASGRSASAQTTPPGPASGRSASAQTTPPGPASGRSASAQHGPSGSRPTLTVGLVGAGRVGPVLAAALARAGHRVVAVSARSVEARARVADLLPDTPLVAPHDVAKAADLVLLTVPDDALAPLLADLAHGGALRPGQVVAHTSGAHGVGVLAAAVAAGARPLAVHPAMTFTGTAADLDRLAAGVAFGVTAPADLRAFATRLVADLGGAVEWVPEQRRPLYHAALAHGANHLVTLVNEAVDRLRDAGVAQPERVLAPLLRAALDNALSLGDDALTGPVSRGDAGTVATHLDVLGHVAPESLPAYLAMARRSADRAIASGRLPAADAEALLDVLAARAHKLGAAV